MARVGPEQVAKRKYELIDSQGYSQQIEWADKVDALLLIRQVAY